LSPRRSQPPRFLSLLLCQSDHLKLIVVPFSFGMDQFQEKRRMRFPSSSDVK
jgi:hypothetical protein